MEKKLEKVLVSKNGKANGKSNGTLKLANVEKISNFQQAIWKQKEKKFKIFNRFFHSLWKNEIQNQNTAFSFPICHINSLQMLLISYSKELSSAILFLITSTEARIVVWSRPNIFAVF